jgi:formylglycine-generating enzyme required for sulfatase activity
MIFYFGTFNACHELRKSAIQSGRVRVVILALIFVCSIAVIGWFVFSGKNQTDARHPTPMSDAEALMREPRVREALVKKAQELIDLIESENVPKAKYPTPPMPDSEPLTWEETGKNEQGRPTARLWIPGKVSMEFILVPVGSFQMGSQEKYEQPIHLAELREFWLGRTEVTVEQFRAFVEATGYKTLRERSIMPTYVLVDGKEKLVRDANWRNPYFTQTDKHPVVLVNWEDAREYCKWMKRKLGLNFRLPSETEWEYACRAQKPLLYYESHLNEYAWYKSNSNGKSHEVGSKLPNDWGLYDMQGNAAEFCEDIWHIDYNGIPTDGSARMEEDPSEDYIQHITRGGGWHFESWRCRSTFRGRAIIPLSSDYLGFRIALQK